MAQSMVGTPFYMAPEVLKRDSEAGLDIGYNEKADIWSVGVIVFELITGRVPFQAKTQFELMEMQQNYTRRMEFIDEANVSEMCKDFLRQIFVADEKFRIDF